MALKKLHFKTLQFMILKEILKYLSFLFQSSVGFRDADVSYIPVSGLTGENLTHSSNQMSWYTGPTLVDAINKLKPPQRLIGKKHAFKK